MKIPFVDLKAQYTSIKDEINNAISNVLDDTSFIGGKHVSDFENLFSKTIGLEYCVSCANGTDAIEIALEALGIGKGDEVLVPVYTWISTASAVSRVGAKPIFVDIDPDSYTIDPSKIEKKITVNCKAIIPVHFHGCPADMPRIMDIARRNNLKVIEDCAQSHLASIDNVITGSFADVSTFSFYPGKNLGAYGDGGAILTDNSELEEKCRIIARLGQRKKHEHIAIGRNSRMDSLQAAILNIKLRYLEEWTVQREQVASWYIEALKGVSVKVPVIKGTYRHVYHLFVIQTERRDELRSFLNDNGVDALIHYPKPLHKIGVFDYQGSFPVAEDLSGKILSLPIYSELTKTQVDYVTKLVKEFFSKDLEAN